MVRYTIDKSPIQITYGCDDESLYLSVCDQRLAYDATTLEEVNNAIRRTYSTKTGAYLKLSTGSFGLKVSMDTIVTYLRRYGVSREQVNDLLKKISTDPDEPEPKSNMIDYVINDQPIAETYIFDKPSNNLILAIHDSRLEYNPDSSIEVNRVACRRRVHGVVGCYFAVHVKPVDFGQTVSKAAMCVFLRRFGIDERRVTGFMNEYKE